MKTFVRWLLLSIVLLSLPAADLWARSGVGLENWGFKAGLSGSTWRGDDAELTLNNSPTSPSTRPAFSFGAFAGIRLASGLSLQPELLYISKGAEWDIPGVKVMARISYLEMPLLLKGTINRGDGISPYAFAGPTVAFKLSADIRETYPEPRSETFEIELNDLSSIDFGLTLGAGARVPLSSIDLVVDLRYTFALTELPAADSDRDADNGPFWIDNGESIGLAADANVRNDTFVLLLGLAF